MVKCAQNLVTLTKHPQDIVRSAAWKALSEFQMDHLVEIPELLAEEETEISGTHLFSIINEEKSDEVFESFGCFLHKVIGYEVENFGRALYTDMATKTDDPIVSGLTSILTETANARGNELAALGMMRQMTANMAPPKRLARCMQIFSNALLRVRF